MIKANYNVNTIAPGIYTRCYCIHNLNEAIYADRVIVLNKGVITLNGSPEEVFKNKEEIGA